MGAFRATVVGMVLMGLGLTIYGVDMWRNQVLHTREAIIGGIPLALGLLFFVPSQAKDAFSFLFGWLARGWKIWRGGRVIDNEAKPPPTDGPGT